MKPILIAACLLSLLSAAMSYAEEPGRRPPVCLIGTLHGGIFAIGGETTGTVLNVREESFELDFSRTPKLAEKVDEFEGKICRVTGWVRRVEGIERKDRWVISVSSLKLAEKEEQEFVSTEKWSATWGQPGTQARFLTEFPKATSLQVHIASETGIDSGTIRRSAERWPNDVVLCLHLKGLESLEFEGAGLTFRCFHSTDPNIGFHASVSENGSEFRELKKDDPLFPKFQQRSRSGVFEVSLPTRLLDLNPETIAVKFVDFHR